MKRIASLTFAVLAFAGLAAGAVLPPVIDTKPEAPKKCDKCPKCECDPQCRCEELTGIYRVSGFAQNRPYAGSCVITERGKTIAFQWSYKGGMPPALGTGVKQGDMIAVRWEATRGPGGGVMLMRVCKKTKTIEATWTDGYVDDLGAETMHWLSKCDEPKPPI